MSFLKLQHIYKSYHLDKQTFPVLKDLNLDFELGEFVSILGESGGGGWHSDCPHDQRPN